MNAKHWHVPIGRVMMLGLTVFNPLLNYDSQSF